MTRGWQEAASGREASVTRLSPVVLLCLVGALCSAGTASPSFRLVPCYCLHPFVYPLSFFNSLLLPLIRLQDLCHLPAWLLRLHAAAIHGGRLEEVRVSTHGVSNCQISLSSRKPHALHFSLPAMKQSLYGEVSFSISITFHILITISPYPCMFKYIRVLAVLASFDSVSKWWLCFQKFPLNYKVLFLFKLSKDDVEYFPTVNFLQHCEWEVSQKWSVCKIVYLVHPQSSILISWKINTINWAFKNHTKDL